MAHLATSLEVTSKPLLIRRWTWQCWAVLSEQWISPISVLHEQMSKGLVRVERQPLTLPETITNCPLKIGHLQRKNDISSSNQWNFQVFLLLVSGFGYFAPGYVLVAIFATCQIYVGNLDFLVKEHELLKAFSDRRGGVGSEFLCFGPFGVTQRIEISVLTLWSWKFFKWLGIQKVLANG